MMAGIALEMGGRNFWVKQGDEFRDELEEVVMEKLNWLIWRLKICLGVLVEDEEAILRFSGNKGKIMLTNNVASVLLVIQVIRD